MRGVRLRIVWLHARRKFDELVKANASTVATQAIGRIAWLYRIEADARDLSCEQRLQVRQERSKPLWEEMHAGCDLNALGCPTVARLPRRSTTA
ncbi:MAG: transposase [Burkholderiales bacterium]|nr:transposase [Burkholderiales bacterium]